MSQERARWVVDWSNGQIREGDRVVATMRAACVTGEWEDDAKFIESALNGATLAEAGAGAARSAQYLQDLIDDIISAAAHYGGNGRGTTFAGTRAQFAADLRSFLTARNMNISSREGSA